MDSAEHKNKKILVIDDEADNLELEKARLEASGYKIIALESGDNAQTVAMAERPDLILLDIMMPKKDGYRICQELKANGSTRDIPVIVFTADYQGEPSIRRRAKEAGADDYILKPFDAKALLAKIIALIKQ